MTAPAKSRTTDNMRALLAFALTVADQEEIELYSVTAERDELRVWIDTDDDREAAHRMATALGIPEDRLVREVEHNHYAISSRGEAPFYYKGTEPYPHTGPSVWFGDRKITVTVIVSLSKVDESQEAE